LSKITHIFDRVAKFIGDRKRHRNLAE